MWGVLKNAAVVGLSKVDELASQSINSATIFLEKLDGEFDEEVEKDSEEVESEEQLGSLKLKENPLELHQDVEDISSEIVHEKDPIASYTSETISISSKPKEFKTSSNITDPQPRPQPVSSNESKSPVHSKKLVKVLKDQLHDANQEIIELKAQLQTMKDNHKLDEDNFVNDINNLKLQLQSASDKKNDELELLKKELTITKTNLQIATESKDNLLTILEQEKIEKQALLLEKSSWKNLLDQEIVTLENLRATTNDLLKEKEYLEEQVKNTLEAKTMAELEVSSLQSTIKSITESAQHNQFTVVELESTNSNLKTEISSLQNRLREIEENPDKEDINNVNESLRAEISSLKEAYEKEQRLHQKLGKKTKKLESQNLELSTSISELLKQVKENEDSRKMVDENNLQEVIETLRSEKVSLLNEVERQKVDLLRLEEIVKAHDQLSIIKTAHVSLSNIRFFFFFDCLLF
jgi:FtsZ-binding cell division protein ZapB